MGIKLWGRSAIIRHTFNCLPELEIEIIRNPELEIERETKYTRESNYRKLRNLKEDVPSHERFFGKLN
jgi:hypothetical protein